ncbi:unnamed protein product [Rotaria sp. Silwood1]|nr:unnamed protein product [Rotaria sp. Silwood1]
MSDDTDLVAKIFPAIEKHKEAFFVIRLRKPFASYATINDTDTLIQCDLMDTRNAFLYFAHDRHHEFLSLRRAKFSTMALLYELHISTKDKFKSNCNTCRQHCDILNHCTICEDFNLCETCYNIEPTHEHRMKRSVPSIVSQSQRQRSMQHCIEALSHSGNCRNSTCDKCNCFRYKRIIQHTKECIGPNNQCNVCKQFIFVCWYHAKICMDQHCQVPFCINLKSKIQKQRATSLQIDSSLDSSYDATNNKHNTITITM